MDFEFLPQRTFALPFVLHFAFKFFLLTNPKKCGGFFGFLQKHKTTAILGCCL
jgi:hypothetical protein